MGGESLTTLVVVPHPDDEVVGAGVWLHRHRSSDIHVLHLTDGSPRDMEAAHSLGFVSREAYAAARRLELEKALAMAGIGPAKCIQFSLPDKESYLNLPSLISRLHAVINELRPGLILSPAYEGGHPDHDAAALAVAAIRHRGALFQHREFLLYHSDRDGRMTTGSFLSNHASAPEEVLDLTQPERVLKAEMFACFRTQREMLNNFQLDCERFRDAPPYDFTKAPHPGPLLYERWGWGITGVEWRQCAAEALVLTGCF